MSQNFTNFSALTTPADLATVNLVGYQTTGTPVEMIASTTNVVIAGLQNITDRIDIGTGSTGFTYTGGVAIGFGNYGGHNSVAVGSNNTLSNGYLQKSVLIGYGNTAGHWGYGATDGAIAVFGYLNTATANKAVAVGTSNTASGIRSSAFGYKSIVSTAGASAFGYENTASNSKAVAVGTRNDASGVNSAVFGYQVTNTVANVVEIGAWTSGTTRGGAVRIHNTGAVTFTALSAAQFTDGAATAGSEADGSLMRGGLAFRVDVGTGHLMADYNDAGTIKTLDIGALSP